MTHVTVESRILATLDKSTIPLKTEQIARNMEKLFEVTYSRQHIKRVVNRLVDSGHVEIVGKSERAELFTIPGKALDPWQDKMNFAQNSSRITIRFADGLNYSPTQLAERLVGMKSTMLNDTVNDELFCQLTLLVMQGALTTYFSTHGISPVQDIRRPVQEMKTRLQNLITVLDSVLSNEAIKTGRAGQTIPSKTVDTLMESLEPYLQAVAMNKRSDINDRRTGEEDYH